VRWTSASVGTPGTFFLTRLRTNHLAVVVRPDDGHVPAQVLAGQRDGRFRDPVGAEYRIRTSHVGHRYDRAIISIGSQGSDIRARAAKWGQHPRQGHRSRHAQLIVQNGDRMLLFGRGEAAYRVVAAFDNFQGEPLRSNSLTAESRKKQPRAFTDWLRNR